MIRYLIILFFSTATLFADATWSDQTTPLDDSQVNKVLNQAESKSFWDINLVDDKQENKYLVKSNLVVFSVNAGLSMLDETLSNKNGSKKTNLDIQELKFVLGKDFTLWHDEFHQYSRLFLAYTYSTTKDNVSYTTFSLGIQERMKYYTFYKIKNWNFYPKISIEAGTSTLKRSNYNIDGFTIEGGASIVAQYHYNYELSFDTTYKRTRWQYPVDGIDDSFEGFYVGLGFSYRIMYGDF